MAVEKPNTGFVASGSQPGNVFMELSRVTESSREVVTDQVTVEQPLEIIIDHDEGNEFTLAITMRTPGQDGELAVGFLFTEGIITSRADIIDISHPGPPGPDGFFNRVKLVLAPSISVDETKFERHIYMSSSCGVCGKTAIDAVTLNSSLGTDTDFHVASGILKNAPKNMRLLQTEFSRTGGIHCVGLFDDTGEMSRIREDVGRHNAMDKLIGSLLLENALPIRGYGLLLSGRASFELLQKAAIAGAGIVAAIGAPSSLAIELAASQNITLVGFVRDKSFNIYCHGERISGS